MARRPDGMPGMDPMMGGMPGDMVGMPGDMIRWACLEIWLVHLAACPVT